MAHHDLVSIFGLIRPAPLDLSASLICKKYKLDYFLVTEYKNNVVLRCQCGRSESLELHPDDLQRAYRVHGLYACPVCLAELRNTKTTGDRFRVWLKQHSLLIAEGRHIHAPTHITKVFNHTSDKNQRVKRFIFSEYYSAELTSEDKILTKCEDPCCVNPLHLQCAASPATKLTPEIISEIFKCTQKKVSNLTIQQLILMRHKRSLSIRTILKVKKELSALNTTSA